ncbi:MAG: FecR family protein [Bryobacteraceae bacterium]
MPIRLKFAATYGLLMTAWACALPAQIFGPQPAEAAATVIELHGQVSVLRDSNAWALQMGAAVQIKQVILTGADGFAVFRVSDGSTFEVYPNSRLTFRNNPGSFRDLLDLWMGRVKVQVHKLGGQANPTRVNTPSAVISVRGTVFDVVVEDEDDTTLVSVDEGQVLVQHALMPRDDGRMLSPGEWLRVYKSIPLAARKGIDKGSIAQFALRALQEAMYTVVTRGKSSGIGRLPGGGGLPGDTGGTPPPPPAPPLPGGGVATPPPPPPPTGAH